MIAKLIVSDILEAESCEYTDIYICINIHMYKKIYIHGDIKGNFKKQDL